MAEGQITPERLEHFRQVQIHIRDLTYGSFPVRMVAGEYVQIIEELQQRREKDGNSV